jgi:hypothetical protein
MTRTVTIPEQFFEYYDGGEWVNDTRFLYEYDANNNMIIQTWESYDYEEDEWIQFRYTTYTYNAQGQLEESISETYLSEDFILSSKVQYEYNQQGLRSAEIFSSREGDDWKFTRRTTYAYDNNNDRILRLNQTALENDWINESRYLYGTAVPTNIADTPHMPVRYELMQNYPNPFNPETTIRFSLPERGTVQLTVYNLLGQRMATLADGMYEAGEHNIVFNARGLSSGVYYYRLHTDGFTQTRKLMLLR